MEPENINLANPDIVTECWEERRRMVEYLHGEYRPSQVVRASVD
jgi:hypothetical protein